MINFTVLVAGPTVVPAVRTWSIDVPIAMSSWTFTKHANFILPEKIYFVMQVLLNEFHFNIMLNK